MTVQAEPRIPPRFVPTLTEVVNVPPGLLPVQPLPQSPSEDTRTDDGGSASGVPTASVSAAIAAPAVTPTSMPASTQVGMSVEMPVLMPASAPEGMPVLPPFLPPAAMGGLEAWSDQITRCVIDQIEQRLPTMVDEHARMLSVAIAHQLRDELPAMVHQAVQTSLATEDPFRTNVDPQRGVSAIQSADTDTG